MKHLLTAGLCLVMVSALKMQASEYVLMESLGEIPAAAEIENMADVEVVSGRLRGRQAVMLKPAATVEWSLNAEEDFFIEFWLKPVGWDGAATEAVEICGFSIGADDYRLYKASGRSELVLSSNAQELWSYPIYSWKEQSWMRQNDEELRWHYINIARRDNEMHLSVDGFETKRRNSTTVQGALQSFKLDGAAGTAFADLHIVKGQTSGSALRSRYHDLYRGRPNLPVPTVTVPWVTGHPTIDGDIDEAEYAEMARLTGFLGRTGRQFEGSGITAYMGYDNEQFYLAIRTPYEGQLQARHHGVWDKPIYQEESYEMFFCPPWTGVPDYVQLVGNPYGDQTDLRIMDLTWDGDWTWEARIQEDAWTGELHATFAGLDFTSPGDGDTWTMNLFSLRADTAWNSSRRHHNVGEFAVLRFDRHAPVLRPGVVEFKPAAISVPFEFIGRGAERELTFGLVVYGQDDMLPANSVTRQVKLNDGQRVTQSLEIATEGMASGRLVMFIREEETFLFAQHGEFPPSPRVVRRGVERAAAAETTPAETADLTEPETEPTPAEVAYARKWSPAEIGEEVLQMTEWWDSELGRSKEVPGPWVPLQVEDQAVITFGQRYEYADSLFPVQIISNGESLLAAPAFVLVESAGKEYRFEAAEVTIEKLNDSEVAVQTTSRSGPFTLTLHKLYEFDGMAKINLKLSGNGGEAIDNASIEFLLQGNRAPLYHYTASFSGHPPGSDSGELPAEGFVLDQFREIIWLGDPFRGFCWFAENMKNWQIKDESNIQRVDIQADGSRALKVKIADRSFVLNKPWEIVFGIQATPTRSVLEDRRAKSDRDLKSYWSWFWGDGQYYPFHRNPEPARQQVESLREQDREVMPCSSQRFYGKFRFHQSLLGEVEDPGLINREVLLWERLWRETLFPPSLEPLPEQHTAPGDWYGNRYQPQGLVGLCAASPFQDYYLWRLHRTIEETGLGAIYLDQPLGRCANYHHGCGYINYKGEYAPSAFIFARREFQKRMHKLFYEKHGFTRIMWHSSNQIIIPVISFTDIFFDGENYAHGSGKVYEFYSDTLSKGRMQTQHTGLPFGFAPSLLPNIEGRYSPTRATVTDMMGYFYVHDSQVRVLRTQQDHLGRYLNTLWYDFPFDQSKQYYYWEAYEGLSVDPGAALYIVHVSDTDVMAILFNPEDRPLDVRLHLDAAALGMQSAVVSLQDAKTGDLFERGTAGFAVPLAPRDVRILKNK